jgi:WD40 repeat protein
MVVAGYDGTLRLLDGKFRSSDVLMSMPAHIGAIKDFCLQSDGRTLVTCGLSSSYQFTPDPQIKVFDLRMQRELNALAVSLPDSSSGVRFVRFLQDGNSNVSDGSVATAIALVTDAGTIQVSDLLADGSVAPQTLYTPLSDPSNEFVMACGVASSGQFLAVGTSHGSIAQYVHVPDLDQQQYGHVLRINEVRCIVLRCFVC